ncbi:hypothetical protein FHU30_006638 [Actinomadura rupiterrae]|nr:hypothetical protein [Actinomadura rupiterrae]
MPPTARWTAATGATTADRAEVTRGPRRIRRAGARGSPEPGRCSRGHQGPVPVPRPGAAARFRRADQRRNRLQTVIHSPNSAAGARRGSPVRTGNRSHRSSGGGQPTGHPAHLQQAGAVPAAPTPHPSNHPDHPPSVNNPTPPVSGCKKKTLVITHPNARPRATPAGPPLDAAHLTCVLSRGPGRPAPNAPHLPGTHLRPTPVDARRARPPVRRAPLVTARSTCALVRCLSDVRSNRRPRRTPVLGQHPLDVRPVTAARLTCRPAAVPPDKPRATSIRWTRVMGSTRPTRPWATPVGCAAMDDTCLTRVPADVLADTRRTRPTRP